MNTTLLLNSIGNLPVMQAQQAQGTGTTDGFTSLLNMLLDGLAKQDANSEVLLSESTGDADVPVNPETKVDTEQYTLMAQSFLSSAQILQYIQMDPPTAVPEVEAEIAVTSGGTQESAVEKLSLKDLGYNAQLSKNKPLELETTDFKSGPDTTAELDEFTLHRTENMHFEIKKSEMNISDGTAEISTVKLNAGSQTTAKDGRTQQDTLLISDPKQSAAQPVLQAKNTSDTGLNEKSQTGEGNIFSEKLEKADKDVEQSSKPSFDIKTQIPDIKHTAQSVDYNSEINKVDETQSGAEVITSAASQISAEALDALKNGKSDFKLTLKPDGLGEIEVTMKLDGGGLSMKISTELQSTQKLISTQLPQLRQELAGGERNLTSLGVELKQNGFSTPNGNAFNGHNDQRYTPTRAQSIPYTGLDVDTDSYTAQQTAFGSKIYYRI